MKTKFTGILLSIALAFSVLTPGVLADEEIQEVTDLPVHETAEEELPPETEDMPVWQEPEPEQPDVSETPSAPEQTTNPTPAPEQSDEPVMETPIPMETPAPVGTPKAEAPVYEPTSAPTVLDENPLSANAGKTGAAVFSVGTKTYSDFYPRALNNETLRMGIDVSNWQGTINWSKVAASGVEFVFIRAAYRGYGSGKIATDSLFRTYIQGAKAAGLKVGVYIYSQAITTAEAVEEAEYLMNTISGYSVDLPLVLDFEYYPDGRLENARLSKRAATDICNAFCDRVEQNGYESMVYANPSMLNNSLYPAELGRLWLAHYTSRTGYSGKAYEYWQCSDSGRIDGISGAVDLDFWFDPNPGLPFRDVSEKNWYYDTVAAAYDLGIVTGVTTDSFSPLGTATRGQVVTMLHRLMEKPAWTTEASFSDLTQEYYKDAVYWAAEAGIVKGHSETEFAPGQSITREQLVTILHRMAQCPEAETDLSAYTDADNIQDWARDAMAWAVETGVVTGYEDATLRPQDNANRAEVCTFLMRYAALTAE